MTWSCLLVLPALDSREFVALIIMTFLRSPWVTLILTSQSALAPKNNVFRANQVMVLQGNMGLEKKISPSEFWLQNMQQSSPGEKKSPFFGLFYF